MNQHRACPNKKLQYKMKEFLQLTRIALSILTCLATAPSWATGGTMVGSGTASNPFVIADAQDWATFAANVNAGINTDKYYKLADDFDNATSPVTDMVGFDEGSAFRGHFDGNNKTLCVSISKTLQGSAPFRYIEGATIENLNVTGTVNCGEYHASGLVGFCNGSDNYILNCHVATNVEGYEHVGGIVGHGSNSTLTMNGCVYSGQISGFDYCGAGGLMGWSDAMTLYMNNCLFKGTFAGSGAYHPVALSYRGGSAVATNVFYLNTAAPTGKTYYGQYIPGADGTPVSDTLIPGEWDNPIVAADGKTYYTYTGQTPLNPSEVQIDGIRYKIYPSKKTSEVISGGNYSGDIVIPSSITNSGITYSVTSIGDNAFSGCSSLTSISIPSSMTAMGEYAFSGCSNLSSVYITDLVKWCQIDFGDWGNPLNVCHHLYLNGVKIQDLVIPDGITSICKDAFIGSDITSVTIPASVTFIGNYAFAYCECLETITIHSTAISMNYASFSGCSVLSSFICMSTTPLSYNNSAFDGGYGPINSNCILYVPGGTVNDYRNAGWGETFSNILEIGTTPEYEDVAIGSKAEWDAFAARVNAGETSLNAHLTASISDAVTTMVGTQSKPYGGTFNGNGYTLTVALRSDDMGCAPFANVRGATIENLKTQGTVTSSGWHASGLVGGNSGKLTIRNCWVDVSIYGSGLTGGFIGHGGEVPGNPLPVLIDNCLFTGSNDATYNAAGFVGWSTTYTPTITNCLNDGTFAYDGFAPIARAAGVGTISNCYYTTLTTCSGSFNDNRGIFTEKTGQELVALLGDGWKVDENNNVIPLTIKEGTNPNTSSPFDITNRSISDSYSQEVNVYGTDYVYFPGNTTAFEGYMVCGVELTDAYWSGYRYYSTFKYSLVPLEQAEQITFICSDENLEIGSTIDGKQILAKSSSFSLAYTPSSTSTGCQTDIFYFFNPDGSIATCSHFFYTAPPDPNDTWNALDNRPKGSFCYCYAVIKETELDQDCAAPAISYVNGKLVFECETPGATFKSNITCEDIADRQVNEIDLSVTYHISVYAIADGYNDSEVSTATLFWIDTEPMQGEISDRVEIPAIPVLMKSQDGTITIEGLGNGTQVDFFTTDDIQLGSTTSVRGVATFSTSLATGTVVIVRIGQKTVNFVVK